MKVLDVTEFYSQRGGGVRSHLTVKSHFSCQVGHDQLVVAPGGVTREEPYAAFSVSQSKSGSGSQGSARVLHVGGPALPYDPTYHLLWRLDTVRRAIEEEHPDVLEIHSPYLAAMGALSVPRSSFGIRTFVWHADFIDTYLRGGMERRLPEKVVDAMVEPLWAWVRTIARGCDATFAAAKWQAEKLNAHGVERVVHLPFGVEKEIF
ncbi:MAG: glycosyltransferase, partial [Polyangiaceae bacterium]